MGESDTRSRKWQLTINNPIEHNLEHNTIKEYLSNLDNLIYWCMCDEIGGQEKTYHTHVYIHLKNVIRFSTLKAMFTTAHIEKANGTAIQNKDYILKQGKYADSEKESTNLKDTFEEMGIIPEESQGKRIDLIDIFEMAKDGIKTVDILSEYPSALLYIDKIEKVRTEIQREKFKNTFHKLDVTYIYGKNGAGKTRYVMDSLGYENVYRVTDYKNMFDSYSMQDVIIFEEFRSSIHVKDMLSLTEEMTGKDIMKLRGVSFSKAQIIRNKAVEYCLIHDIEIGAKKVSTEVVLIVTGHDINYYFEKMLLEAKQVCYECI